MIRAAFATIGVLFLSLAAYAAPIGLGYAADYNVFTLRDLSTPSDISGRVAVGGNLKDILTVGNDYGTEWPASSSSTSVFTYLANGNGGNTVHNNYAGYVYLGAAGTGTIDGKGTVLNGWKEGVSLDPASVIDFGNARTYFNSLSSTIAAQSAIGGIVSKGGDNRYSLTATSDAVFNLTAGEFMMLKSIETNGHTVLVNVAGTKISFDSGNNITVDGVQTMGDRTKVSNVLFNFRDATSVSLDGALYGSILAPKASLTTNHNLKGQIIVDNLLHSGEIHAAKFTGILPPTSVPEPATLVLMGSGLFGMWGIRRRIQRR